jgi:hypothetical protein
MDAITLLKGDHDRIKDLIARIEGADDRAVKSRGTSFKQLVHELAVHEGLEEELLYPALRDHEKTHDLVLESYEEHHVLDQLVAEMEELPVADETWSAKLTVLKENLEHHIGEEEHDLFKSAKRILGKAGLVELGLAMERMRRAAERAGVLTGSAASRA